MVEEKNGKKLYRICCLVQQTEGFIYTAAELETMESIFDVKPTHDFYRIEILETQEPCNCSAGLGTGYQTPDKNTVYICI